LPSDRPWRLRALATLICSPRQALFLIFRNIPCLPFFSKMCFSPAHPASIVEGRSATKRGARDAMDATRVGAPRVQGALSGDQRKPLRCMIVGVASRLQYSVRVRATTEFISLLDKSIRIPPSNRNGDSSLITSLVEGDHPIGARVLQQASCIPWEILMKLQSAAIALLFADGGAIGPHRGDCHHDRIKARSNP
jgi:hypothetical protein